jgi:hypothetical protein
MTTQREIHLTLPIRIMGFQRRARVEEEYQQNLGMYRFLQFK